MAGKKTIYRSEFNLSTHYLVFFVDVRVSNVIDYYVQLREIIIISCNFTGLHAIGETSISRNNGVISRNLHKLLREIL